MWDTITKDNLVLLMVDFQDSFFKILRDGHVQLVRNNILLLIRMFDRLGIPMLGTEHYVKGLGHTDPEVLAAWKGDPITDKVIFSCCGDPEFVTNLASKKREVVVLTGLETHICVYQTARDLIAEGYRVVVPADAVLSSTTLRWKNGLDLMKDAGAIIANTETLIFHLLHRADSPEFKYLVSLLKEMG